jgi:fatty acid desaturase
VQLQPADLELARAYQSQVPFETLTGEQLRRMGEHAQRLHLFVTSYPVAHNAISFAVVAFLVLTDIGILLLLPAIVAARMEGAWWITVAVAVVAGSLHSLVIYSMVVFSLHEGAAHNRIFTPRGAVTRAMAALANNLCRLGSADPVYYANNHRSHHSKFGTEEDGEFLNFVPAKRYWPTLLPFAMFINYNDFVVHRPMFITRALLRSMAVSFTYHVVIGLAMWALYGFWFTVIALMLVTPHVGFFVDRLRHYSEHNLMPLDHKNGARSFGLGFWGLLIGGGPWGQPCHLIHHMFPVVPWYGQLILHRKLKALLTPRQREQFLLRPVIGFPLVCFRLLRESQRFADSVAHEASAG